MEEAEEDTTEDEGLETVPGMALATHPRPQERHHGLHICGNYLTNHLTMLVVVLTYERPRRSGLACYSPPFAAEDSR